MGRAKQPAAKGSAAGTGRPAKASQLAAPSNAAPKAKASAVGGDRPGKASQPAASSTEPPKAARWTCKACDEPNKEERTQCNNCGASRPAPAQQESAQNVRDTGMKANDMTSLKDATIAFTGELDGMTRDEAEDKVKAAGGKVMGSISGNTTYLVVGSHLDDGRPVEATSKYRKYLDLKAKGKKWPTLLNEAQLASMLGAPAAPPKPVVVAPQPAHGVASVREPWVDKYIPKSFDDLLGNASAVKKLSEWLRDWDDVVLRGRTKMARFKPGGGMPDNLNARAALVSGPPGIGKTSACRLVTKLLGRYEVLEYNASDARSKKIIEAMADGIANNHTLSFGSSNGKGLGAAAAPKLTKRVVIIMDEVDGMGAGDRGGNAALIRMIKKTKNPIICICNDHGSPKIRSLTFSCYDIRFSRPSKGTIAQRVAQIAGLEGLAVEPNALEALAESCGNDVRHVLNQLQAMSVSPEYRQQGVGYMDMRDRIKEISKDAAIMLGPFDACKNLLTSSKVQRMPINERLDNFFVDYNLVHLLVQENYLNSVAQKPVEVDLLQSCARSAELIAQGDILGQRIREHQEWNLLPDMGLTAAVYPAHITNGFVAFPEFPKFLGNYSRQSRARRLCLELHVHLRLSSSAPRRRLVSSNYLEVLHSRAMQPLRCEDIDGAVAVLDAYGLQREHLAEHLSELRQHLGAEDDFKLVDPKVKAAMTRELNQGAHAMKVVLPGSKKRKAVAADADDLGEDGEPSDPLPPQDEGAAKDGSDDEGAASSKLVKQVKARKNTAKSDTKARASGASARASVTAKSASKEPKAASKSTAAAAEAKVAGTDVAKAAAKAKGASSAPAKAKAKSGSATKPAKKARTC